MLENLVKLIDDVICSSSGPSWESLREKLDNGHLYKRIRFPKASEAPGPGEEYELDWLEECGKALYNVEVVVQPYHIIKYVPSLFQCKRDKVY